ncbi:hypothetical protein ISS07_03255 [Candidatus Woesearchaeota archaeon]|nr:hypothetical protein [Candidatus Woesearchaeota archaeon]
MVLLFDQNNIPANVFEIVFSTTQQKIVGKVLVDFMKQNNGEISKMKLSLFATKLNEGEVVTEIEEEPYKGKQVKLSYNKRQFYDRILTPMRAMGLIDYDLYKKTYKISGDFSNALKNIGDAWQEELGKNPLDVKFGKTEL